MKPSNAHACKLQAILWLVAVLSSCGVVNAQRAYSPELYLGIKGGSTLSKTLFTPHVKQGWEQGAIGGIVVRYTEEKLFGLIAEIDFEQRGWKEDFEGAPFSYDRRLNYIQVPLLTHIYFGNRVKGFVNLGPTFGYMIGSKISSNFNYVDPSSIPDFPIRNRSITQMSLEIDNRFDYGIVGGLGVELTVARRHSIMIEGRYYFGIGNIFSSAKKDPFSASRNSSIAITAAYMFKVK